MTSPPVTIDVNASLDEIVGIFEKKAISAVPVVEDERLVGVVSTTDVVRTLPRASPGPIKASSIMSAPVVVARPDEALDEAAWRLVAGRVHRLVVTVGDKAVGILSARDVLEEILSRRIDAKVGGIMTTPVETVGIGDTIEDATRRLASVGVHGLVVVDGMSPVGIFTHAEALAARSLPPELRARPVEQVMSYETICLDVETPVFRAAAYGMAMNVRRFLIVEHRRLVGIVSCVDLVGALSRAPEA